MKYVSVNVCMWACLSYRNVIMSTANHDRLKPKHGNSSKRFSMQKPRLFNLSHNSYSKIINVDSKISRSLDHIFVLDGFI